MSPFDILRVSEDADDATVRAAYLHAIRLYPPTLNPVQFSRIASAYAQIETADKRLRYRVSGKPELAPGDLLEQALVYGTFERSRPDYAGLKQQFIAHNRNKEQTGK